MDATGDLAEYLKSLHKKSNNLHDHRVETKKATLNRQKTARSRVFLSNRNIAATPTMNAPRKRLTRQNGIDESTVVPEIPKKTTSRRELLVKWQAERAKMKEAAKKKAKPLFKFCHIPQPTGLPNLEKVNFEIKGKSIAPKNYKFKAPKNVQPLNFTNEVSEKRVIMTRSRTAQLKTEDKVEISVKRNSPIVPQAQPSQKVTGRSKKKSQTKSSNTKSSTRFNFAVTDVKPAESRKNTPLPQKIKANHESASKTTQTGNSISDSPAQAESAAPVPCEEAKTPLSESKYWSASTSLMSQDYPAENNSFTSSPLQKTPSPVYISPFVTVARGKTSARKEFQERKSRGGFSPHDRLAQSTSTEAGVIYFANRLDSEIERLQVLAQKWHQYKDDQLPEEAISMIDVATGQTNLLISKKFEQFRGLLNDCLNSTGEKAVTCEDLHGFWDMMYIQVVNLDKRFDNLERLKSLNWEEVKNEPKRIQLNKKVTQVKKAQATSTLRDAIRAARMKRQQQPSSNDQSDDVVIVSKNKTPDEKRRSVLDSVQSSCHKERRTSSPGLTMMRVSQIVKNLKTTTPSKSILKNDLTSTAKKSKSVLFRDASRSEKSIKMMINEDENDFNSSNTAISPNKAKTPTRRSSRKNITKLFE